MDFTNLMPDMRRPVTSEEGNAISNLPGHVTDSILERLPIQDIIRTSILSKKWRYKWTTAKSVVFDEQISKKLAENGAFGRHGFIRVINQVLLLHKGSISKFYLYIPDMFLDSFQDIDQWMLYLSTKGVQDLTVNANSNRPYQLPSCVFSCLELRKLELGKCIFKPPPLQFEGFLSLESLTLKSIDFTTDVGGTVINLPRLKNLALMFTKMPEVRWLLIDGHFVKDYIAEKPMLFPHADNSLKRLWLYSFSLGDLDHLHGVIYLLRNSPNLEELRMLHIQTESELTHHGVEATSDHLESPDCLDQSLNQLRTVELSPLQGSKPELLFIKLLLAHSPSLEKFTIQANGTLDANKRLNIAKEVMRFRRASSMAEMIYLDP